MVFSDDVLIRVAILILGLCGFVVARHIHKHKNNEAAPLVCPIKFDCHGVVHSDYSTFLGIHLEVLGMFYYGLLSLAYAFFIFLPSSMPSLVVNFMIGLSLVAFLFSFYLMSLLIFVLKKACSWCIVSALISATIFVLTIATYHFSYIVQLFIR
ncbi:MAG: vitamin K epoxide reductase family protein [Candidatus Pacebacteria bacterium]|nr:vitamin K epoxide reductase family protein [Candidatus Paceibacterota bacterium]